MLIHDVDRGDHLLTLGLLSEPITRVSITDAGTLLVDLADGTRVAFHTSASNADPDSAS